MESTLKEKKNQFFNDNILLRFIHLYLNSYKLWATLKKKAYDKTVNVLLKMDSFLALVFQPKKYSQLM